MKNVMEDIAKERWCPFAVVTLGEDSAGSRPYRGSFEESNRCLGSGCMAWCYANPDTVCYDGEDEGYCGLARLK